MFSTEIILASRNPNKGEIITSLLTYPRIIHSEFMTHRMFSRNAASSRAIPAKKMIEAVETEPFIPIHWGAAQAGMRADNQVADVDACVSRWLNARDAAAQHAKDLLALGLHKQVVNRILEPWCWITVVCTGTMDAYQNFFKLRCHPDAEPHINHMATMLRKALDCRKIQQLGWNELHLPFADGRDTDPNVRHIQSVARCARVSYLRHMETRTIEEEIDLYTKLHTSGHWSPFEHQAMAVRESISSGNLRGNWCQFRKAFQQEYV